MQLLITIIFVFSFTIFSYAQELNIHKNNGTVQSFLINDIDSITFSINQVDCPSQVDHGGKVYNTVLIGDQCWFRENLDLGTRINASQQQTNNGVIEKYCYNDNPSNCTTYGGLYQWTEAMQYVTIDGAQGICPSGWHIPRYSDFQILSMAVSNNSNALKAIGQGSGAGAGTNTSGFSGLLGGYRTFDGTFLYLGAGSYHWSSTQDLNLTDANYLVLSGSDNIVYFSLNAKALGLSIRCLKD